ncbi:NifU family protein [Geothrix fermentans]|jgi:Fe-S cluster biogenesis protein NfuA|uniref:NifU family protein n=1 Tax=Geothrix fermentans TaxID=44676 RepID=UPI0004018539|nr:NifU family protein [Geothrix fermentans]
MPKIAEIEYTPNPNAVKFVLKEPVALGFPKSFPNVETAQEDELAKGLFAVGNVTSVFMQDKFLTVTKTDDKGWPEMLPLLAAPIRAAAGAGGGQAPPPGAPRVFSKVDDANDPMLRDIRMVLESAILPALAADGGGLELIGRHEKQVMIRYMGACGSCPASLTGTLVAIEGMLQKEVDPEIVVISV